MTEYNANNERLKRQYLRYLKEATSRSQATVDQAAHALALFERETNHRDFKAFHSEAAIAFKKRLTSRQSSSSGRPLAKATLYSTFAHLRRFFHWLALQPGYRSRFSCSDADYFNLSKKESRVATARRERPFPTLEQVLHVIETMPVRTEIERRDRALVAFALLTGARDSALASMKLKHVCLIDGKVEQDAREVNTKNSKSFPTFFFHQVGGEVLAIVTDWVNHLRRDRLWGHDAPLFPAPKIVVGADGQFAVVDVQAEHWRTAAPIRRIFKSAFTAAGLPYFNPHSFRSTLVQLGEKLCRTPEDFKAWSQNLGHEGVLTTFQSYGAVAARRQGEIIRGLDPVRGVDEISPEVLAAALRKILGSAKGGAVSGEPFLESRREL